MEKINNPLLKSLYETELNIIGILTKLEEIEKNKGIDSHEYHSMCGLLQDFLSQEESIAIKIASNKDYLNKTLDCFYNKNSIFDIDEAIWPLNFSMKECIPYRIYKLLSAFGEVSFDTSFIDRKISLDFLSQTDDTSLKYKFAFVNYSLCNELAKNYFKLNQLQPSILEKLFEGDSIYEIEKDMYLSKRYCEIIGYIALYDHARTDINFQLLMSIKNQMSENLSEKSFEGLTKTRIPSDKLNYVHTTLKQKELLKHFQGI